MWSLIFSVSSVLIAILSLAAALSAVQRVTRALESLQAKPDLRESQLQSLKDSMREQADAIEVLSNRIKMTKVRNNANHVRGSHGEPDARADPEAWRAWKNSQLRAGEFNS